MPKSRQPTESIPETRPVRSQRSLLLFVFVAVLVIVSGVVAADWWFGLPDDVEFTYVGRQSCIQCHQQQAERFSGSHHDLAMDLATPETVLGDFDDAMLEHYGITSHMFQADGKYWIHTEGPDGEMADFEIKYVFGHDPLQQYMVEFGRGASVADNEVPAVQVLRVSWDTKKKQWFYLSPPDVREKLAPDDDLHWTGIAQRWNTMCADCHSTNLKKGFDTKTLTYHTTFSEIDVSCEACHGPGSAHVEMANSKSLFWDRKHGYGLARLKGNDAEPQIQTCAKCHSRRRILTEDFKAGDNFYDHYGNELFQPQTYFCDGQILDEVYVHGSYLQSKMYHKGIRCTDCHDPHTARLKFEGNKVCTSCHQHSAGKYDTPLHHQHQEGSRGASCVECHMPETTYMDVDPRRDHSLRVPRPDLSVKYGTPNACTRCHLELKKVELPQRDQFRQYNDWVVAAMNGDAEVKAALTALDEWAQEYCDKWFPQSKYRGDHFADALHAAWNRDPRANIELRRLAANFQTPAIVRASGIYQLGLYASPEDLNACAQSLSDANPLVRAAALGSLETQLPSQTDLEQIPDYARHGQLSPEQMAAITDRLQPVVDAIIPLLTDPSRLVRTEAGRVLSRLAPDLTRACTDGRERAVRDAAIDEYRQAMLVNNDRAGTHIGLGILYENLNQLAQAQTAYQTAMRVEPLVVGPRTQLAALSDRIADQADRDARRAINQRNQQGYIEAMGEVEKHRAIAAQLRQEELPLLARDARLAPDNAGIQYRYGMSLYLNGQMAAAETALKRAETLDPNTTSFVLALALLYQKLERWEEALEYAERVVELEPQNPSYQALLNDIRARQ